MPKLSALWLWQVPVHVQKLICSLIIYSMLCAILSTRDVAVKIRHGDKMICLSEHLLACSEFRYRTSWVYRGQDICRGEKWQKWWE